MSNARTQWMKEIIHANTEAPDEVIEACLKHNGETIDEWFKNGLNGSKIFFYTIGASEGKPPTTVEMSAESPAIQDKVVYFLKNSEKAVNPKNRSDNFILTGYVSKQTLISMLEHTITDVYQPMLELTDEWKSILSQEKTSIVSPITAAKTGGSENPKTSFLKKGKQFAELLHTNLENLSVCIDLPLPSAPYDNIDPSADFDRVKSDSNAKFKYCKFAK